MKFHRILVLLCALKVWGIQWPWEDDSSSSTSTPLQSALPTSSNVALVAGTNYENGQAYVPKETECPTESILREATEIYDNEKEYLKGRHEVTNENLADFLKNVAQLSDFDAEKFIDRTKDSHNITIGLAFSGGGYRAMLAGAGELLALDDRYSELSLSGLGGLLQSSTYITGLSGGSWMVGSLALNDWMSVEQAMDADSGIWDLDDLIFNPSGINVINTVKYYNALREALNAKEDSGFETSITDVWGRALSYQFFNPETTYNGGENLTWSGIRGLASFENYSMPFPIVVANGRNPGTLIINENSTVFEFTPYELGLWDPSLNSFIDINYLGTSLDNGKPNASQCVTNFDNAGFVMGTSSSLFNQALVRVSSSTDLNWAVKLVLKMILQPFSDNNVDIAVYEPNPFYNSEYAELDHIVSDSSLNLVDGGEDMQNVPFYPLIQNLRDVDVIFAYDNSADKNQWPNGTAIVYTFGRQFSHQGHGTPFPYVPPVSEFVSSGLNTRPTFFGCDARNLSDLVDYHENTVNETDIPLVVYIPNSEYSYEANTSTYKMSYDRSELRLMIQNGFEVSSRGNYSDDSEWPTCVGCAIIRRQQERWGEEQSDECKKCFEEYCWKGGIEDTIQQTIGSLNTSGLTALSLSSATSLSRSSVSASITTSTTGTTSASRTTSMQTNQGTVAAESTSVSTSTSQAGGGRAAYSFVVLILSALSLI